MTMQDLGNAVYPRVLALVGEGLAGKVTGMLLQMPPRQLLGLMYEAPPEAFRAAVDKALSVLPAEMLESLRISSPAAAATAMPRAARPVAPPEAPPGVPPMVHQPLRPPPPSLQAALLPADAQSDSAVRSIGPTAEEVRASAELVCGVCLEPVVARRGRFGLLEGCDHSFCVECLRNWRSTHAIRPDVARACPECRTPSHFVVPSSVHVAGTRKTELTRAYLASLRSIPCKHFNHGEGTCPFGSSCFYAHTDKLGRPVVIEPRRAVGATGATVLPSYRLSDYLFPEANDGSLGTDALLGSIPLAPSSESTREGEAPSGNDGDEAAVDVT